MNQITPTQPQQPESGNSSSQSIQDQALPDLGAPPLQLDAGLPALVPLTVEQREAVEKTIADLKRMEEQTGKLVGSWTPRLRAPVEEYLRVLDSGNDRYGRCVLTADEIDDLIRNALLLNQSGEYDPLIIAACAAYSRCDRGNHANWSHAVCHNFERYASASPQDSLLGHPALAQAVEHLLEESVKRLIESKDVGSFGRTVKGVIKYALGHVDPAHIDEPFPSKPQCLSDERLVAALSPHRIEGIFCRAETPREFIEGVAALIAASPNSIYPPGSRSTSLQRFAPRPTKRSLTLHFQGSFGTHSPRAETQRR